MIHSDAAAAFDLSQEPAKVRDTYGKGVFGQGCLLARRLVEHGVPFVEVSLSSSSAGSFGWDTHANNFEAVKALSAELDAGWASLLSDLSERGLLESTTIVWMGEFGRTPQINGQAGRDHFPKAWSCVLARRRHRRRPGLRPHERRRHDDRRRSGRRDRRAGDAVLGAGRAAGDGEHVEHGPADQDRRGLIDGCCRSSKLLAYGRLRLSDERI